MYPLTPKALLDELPVLRSLSPHTPPELQTEVYENEVLSRYTNAAARPERALDVHLFGAEPASMPPPSHLVT